MSDERTERRGMDLAAFLEELKRRHVVRAMVAYAAVAFVVLQAAEIVREAFLLPDWALRLVVVFALLGFPLVLALAWVYELTPGGLRTMAELDEGATPEVGRLPRIAFLALTVVVVGASGWWWVRSTVGEGGQGAPAGSPAGFAASTERAPGDPIRSVAVLPFESFAAEPDRDYFAQGMHEALISQLGQLDFLRVLSRTSSVEYDTGGKSAPQIGSELGVDALVEGSVLIADGRVRITVQLIEAATDAHLWARDYERDLVDVIALQREVAEAIAAELRGELSPPADASAERTAELVPPVDPEAAEAVMMGRNVLAEISMEGTPNAASLDAARSQFERALVYDSSFVEAYRGLAQVDLLRGLRAEGAAARDAIASANAFAGRALELDPTSGETRELVAHLEMLEDEDRTLMPTTELGRQLHLAFARRDAGSGAPGADLRAARRFVAAGRLPEAEAILERVTESDPQNAFAWEELEQLHRMSGDLQSVVTLWEERAEGLPSGAEIGARAQALTDSIVRRGMQGYWSWRVSELEDRRSRGLPVSTVDLAAAHLGAGDRERALDLLTEAAERGDPRIRGVRADPVWDPVRRDPRFMAALAEVDRPRGPPRPPATPGGG